MTGALRYFEHARDTPAYTQLSVEFDNGCRLAYVAPRKLGCIALADHPKRFVAEKALGPNALDLDLEAFRALARGRRGAVKSWLMNQHVMAGIGNAYADEILF